ncbi:MAG: OmpA family protein [Actinomycetota bacterium]
MVDRTGREVTVGPTLPVEGDPRAMQRKLDLLNPGQYTVGWITVSTRDGHTRQGTYTFGIATASHGNERIENNPVASEGWLGIVGRFAALLGLGLWAGFSLMNSAFLVSLFDRYEIRPQDAAILKENAEWLQASRSVLLLIEGHADERGTNESNLAQATRDYLVSLGVDASRITGIRYGEERPLCTERTEACWAPTRRAHFLVKQ